MVNVNSISSIFIRDLTTKLQQMKAKCEVVSVYYDQDIPGRHGWYVMAECNDKNKTIIGSAVDIKKDSLILSTEQVEQFTTKLNQLITEEVLNNY